MSSYRYARNLASCVQRSKVTTLKFWTQFFIFPIVYCASSIFDAVFIWWCLFWVGGPQDLREVCWRHNLVIPKTMFELFGWLWTTAWETHKSFSDELEGGKTSQERRSRDPEASLWISGTISAQPWRLVSAVGAWRDLQLASETSEGRHRLQLSTRHQIRTAHSGAQSVRVPLRAGAKGWDQCVCQTLPAHTVHDTPFLLWCIYLVSGWYGRRSGKAGVPI